ncbi:MAG: Rrf2 family transcriptional regulator [Oscillospiraceae bacterium]
MHITKESDYAVRIVYCLADGIGRIDAKTISERTGVTLRFSLKILNKLVQSGIVKSYKGAKGGYELARSPKEINLKMIIETIEGTYSLVQCTDPAFECSHNLQGLCKFKREFARITQQTNRELEKVTFDQFL